MFRKKKKKNPGAVGRAAAVVGHALGRVAGTIEALHAAHPHPVRETRKALHAGRETLSTYALKAGAGAASVVTTATTLTRRTQRATSRARRRNERTITRAARAARDAAKRAKRSVERGRKAVTRAVKRIGG